MNLSYWAQRNIFLKKEILASDVGLTPTSGDTSRVPPPANSAINKCRKTIRKMPETPPKGKLGHKIV